MEARVEATGGYYLSQAYSVKMARKVLSDPNSASADKLRDSVSMYIELEKMYKASLDSINLAIESLK